MAVDRSFRQRRSVALAALAALSITPALAAADPLLEFLPPHRAQKTRATLSRELEGTLKQNLERSPPENVDALIAHALKQTGALLHFGLQHKTSLHFSSEREGNCIEYSHLFAKLLEQGARKAGLRVSAYSVHSSHATLFGVDVPMRGFHDHDWSLVVARDSAGKELARYYVDATLFDAGLDWNIRSSVHGEPRIP